MKNIKRDKYKVSTQNTSGHCFDSINPNTYWENFRIQKEMK
jgi:hypothetical protein